MAMQNVPETTVIIWQTSVWDKKERERERERKRKRETDRRDRQKDRVRAMGSLCTDAGEQSYKKIPF